jgi:hypothetical protein
MFVTVDGDADAVTRVEQAVGEWTASVLRVGQPEDNWNQPLGMRAGRLGVAVNKNTGLEALMDDARCDDLFLSDDDSWPLSTDALGLHLGFLAHSMVCWGRHRKSSPRSGYAAWTWPRGAVLFVEREVVEQVGGMIEAFGPGGHEHVEWSRRICVAGLTPADYPTPLAYIEDAHLGARRWWHCEDMPQPGETVPALLARRRRLTSIRRQPIDEVHARKIMAVRRGRAAFVPYRAADNHRSSATLSPLN